MTAAAAVVAPYSSADDVVSDSAWAQVLNPGRALLQRNGAECGDAVAEEALVHARSKAAAAHTASVAIHQSASDGHTANGTPAAAAEVSQPAVISHSWRADQVVATELDPTLEEISAAEAEGIEDNRARAGSDSTRNTENVMEVVEVEDSDMAQGVASDKPEQRRYSLTPDETGPVVEVPWRREEAEHSERAVRTQTGAARDSTQKEVAALAKSGSSPPETGEQAPHNDTVEAEALGMTNASSRA